MKMEEGEKKASSESAREKWRKFFFFFFLVNKWRKVLAGVNTKAATSGHRRFSSPASAANVSIPADEVAMLHGNQARIGTEEVVNGIQLVVTSTGTSPETQYFSCTDAEQNDENREPSCRRDGSKRKVLEWIFAIANFIVELLSIVFDQLSSQGKPVFLPVCLGMSILAVLICLCELVYKIRKEKAIWKRKSFFPWFYHPSGVRFGSFADFIGLACACGQCMVTAVNYSLFLKHGNTPIKVSIWASIFAFGQLCSKMWGEFNFKENVGKRKSSSTDLTSLV